MEISAHIVSQGVAPNGLRHFHFTAQRQGEEAVEGEAEIHPLTMGEAQDPLQHVIDEIGIAVQGAVGAQAGDRIIFSGLPSALMDVR
jgi:hypothetical protein